MKEENGGVETRKGRRKRKKRRKWTENKKKRYGKKENKTNEEKDKTDQKQGRKKVHCVTVSAKNISRKENISENGGK